jgi:hypothetical protein
MPGLTPAGRPPQVASGHSGRATGAPDHRPGREPPAHQATGPPTRPRGRRTGRHHGGPGRPLVRGCVVRDRRTGRPRRRVRWFPDVHDDAAHKRACAHRRPGGAAFPGAGPVPRRSHGRGTRGDRRTALPCRATDWTTPCSSSKVPPHRFFSCSVPRYAIPSSTSARPPKNRDGLEQPVEGVSGGSGERYKKGEAMPLAPGDPVPGPASVGLMGLPASMTVFGFRIVDDLVPAAVSLHY